MFLLKSDPFGLDLPTGRTDGRAAAALARAQGGCGPAGSCRLAAPPARLPADTALPAVALRPQAPERRLFKPVL